MLRQRFKMQFEIFEVIGIWNSQSSNGLGSGLRKGKHIFTTFLIAQLWIMSTIFLFVKEVSLEDKLEGLFTSITSFLCVIKFCYITKYKRQLCHIVEQLKENFFKQLGKEEAKYLKRATRPTATSYVAFQTIIILSVFTYTFFPVGKNSENKPLPVFSWYPQYFSSGTPYKITYLIQIMSIICAGTLWVTVDIINFGLLAHLNAMLKVLSHRIETLGWNTVFVSTDEKNRFVYKTLRELIQYYNAIRRYDIETKHIYGSTLFAKITLSSIIICSFVYQLSFKPASYGGFVAQIAILGIVVNSLFMLAWISEEIRSTSNELLNKAAACNFVEMDSKSTKSLVIFMHNISKTIVIEVGSTFSIILDLKTFVKIIDFAYKCLTLLQTAT